DVASQVAKAYSILCEKSRHGDDHDMTILWRARRILGAYDALIAHYHDQVGKFPTENLWTVNYRVGKAYAKYGRSGQEEGAVHEVGSDKKAKRVRTGKARQLRRVRSRSKAR